MDRPVTTCSIEGCGRIVSARGLCGKHYALMHRLGIHKVYPLAVRPEIPWFCECPDPVTDGLGECDSCHRKPRALMVPR